MMRLESCMRPEWLWMAILVPLSGCATLGNEADRTRALMTPDTELRIALEPARPKPGEAVVVRTELRNLTQGPIEVPIPDHANMVFSYLPAREDGARAMQVVDPIFSELEPTGQTALLEPDETLERRFLFTVLALKRGDFRFQAIYQEPSDTDPDGFVRVYSNPVAFSVSGEQVAHHRTVDGLLARRDAVALAAEAAGYAPFEADAILARDRAGFQKWWVNVWRAPEPEASLRSFLIDPYLGSVWGEAERPFDRDEFSGGSEAPPAGMVQRRRIERRANLTTP